VETTNDLRVKAVIWAEPGTNIEFPLEGEPVYMEVERSDADEIALHTMNRDGEGSIWSTYFSRERAIEIARQLLNAAQPR
jgi:hypothetical protein